VHYGVRQCIGGYDVSNSFLDAHGFPRCFLTSTVFQLGFEYGAKVALRVDVTAEPFVQ
jgi:hypothetical protein